MGVSKIARAIRVLLAILGILSRQLWLWKEFFQGKTHLFQRMCSVTNFFPIYQERSQEKKVSMPLSNENFIFFSAPDLDVHEPSISYVKSCRAL